MLPEAVWLAAGAVLGVLAGMAGLVIHRRNIGRRIAASVGVEPMPLTQLARVLAARAASQDSSTRESERRLAVLEASLDGMDEGVAVMDDRDTVLYANRAFRSMVGEDVRSLAFHPVVDVSGRARRSGGAQDDFESGYPVRSLRVNATSLGGGRVLTIIRDVTDSLLLEKVRRDFAAAASHELKTPAASIRAAAETILGSVDDDPAAAKRFANKLLSDSERLVHLVNDLLDLSRLESGPADKKPVRLDRIVAEEFERTAPLAEAAGVRVQVQIGEVSAPADSGDIRLAVSNLLDNAIRYTRPQGSVTVTTGSDGSWAWVEIADTGIGIPRDQLDRIFERFYRVDKARSRDSGGTGLGLALVKHIADRHGGRIEARSELGKGSRFRLMLPTSSEDT